MERLTSQKAIILDYLKSVRTHPSAEEVYLNVRKKLPRISLGTVYRNLNLLKKKGQLQEILAAAIHYDGNISPHAHFICQDCQTIYDIFDQCHLLKTKKTKVGEIKQYQIYLYGQCKKCSK